MHVSTKDAVESNQHTCIQSQPKCWSFSWFHDHPQSFEHAETCWRSIITCNKRRTWGLHPSPQRNINLQLFLVESCIFDQNVLLFFMLQMSAFAKMQSVFYETFHYCKLLLVCDDAQLKGLETDISRHGLNMSLIYLIFFWFFLKMSSVLPHTGWHRRTEALMHQRWGIVDSSNVWWLAVLQHHWLILRLLHILLSSASEIPPNWCHREIMIPVGSTMTFSNWWAIPCWGHCCMVWNGTWISYRHISW